jgi:RNA polymerase sigma factor (sigma-70 family)
VLDEAGHRMVIEHENLARSAAYGFWRKAPRADLDELRSIAYLGLVEAAERYPRYVEEHGYDPADGRFVVAYLSRRVHGSILDWARAQDWLTRSQRTILKIIEDVARPGASDAELAQASGIAEEKVRAAQAAAASKPLSFGMLDGEAEWAPSSLPDPAADVESAAWVRAMLASVARTFAALATPQQCLVLRVYMHGQALAEAAEALGISKEEAGELHASAVLAVHDSMLAVAAEGCPCGRDGGSCGCSAR